MGCDALHIGDPRSLRDALAQGLRSAGPTVIDVQIA
jgi:thiamine pyrophosphate-dependent acetolactate synthase large subunit-like protein